MSDSVKFDLPPARGARARPGWTPLFGLLLMGGVAGFALRAFLGEGVLSAPPASAAPATLLTHEELTDLAETLERNQLYAEAARAWERAAQQSPPQGADKGELLFRIGKNLSLANEHERALGYLFAAEAADVDDRWSASINTLVLENLSALGREEVRAHQAARRVALKADGEDAPAIVAHIGGEPVSEVDLKSFARRMITQQMGMQRQFLSPEDYDAAVNSAMARFETAEGRQQLLQVYVSQELLYREALAFGLAEDEQVRRRTREARRQILTDAFLNDYLARNLHLDASDVQNAYEAGKPRYVEPEAFKMDALIVKGDQAKAQASAALEEGTAFTEVVEEFGQPEPDVTAPGPFERWISRGDPVPMVRDGRAALAHIMALEVGQVGGKWFEGSDGTWLRFRLADRRPARQLALEECRDRVEQDLRAKKQEDLLKQLQESLHSKYQVAIQEDAPPPRKPQEENEDS